MKKVLIGLLVTILIGGAGLMAYMLKETDGQGSLGESLATIGDKMTSKGQDSSASKGMEFVDPSKAIAENGIGGMKASVRSSKKKNRDTSGWIRVPGTAINNAVMQSTNNEKYWRLNENLEYDIFGCYFADYRSSLSIREELSRNTVIYGHSDVSGEEDKPDGKEFSQLHKFADAEFAKNTPYIYLSTEKDELTFEVFAVLYTDLNFDYINVTPSDEQMQYILDEAKARSIYNYPAQVTTQDKIITLSTCTVKYGHRDDQRFVVMGRLINFGENDMISVEITENPEPKQPQFS